MGTTSGILGNAATSTDMTTTVETEDSTLLERRTMPDDINMPMTSTLSTTVSRLTSTGLDNSTMYSTTANASGEVVYWSTPTMIGLAALLALIMVVSIVGNSLILLSMIIFKHLRTKTNIFIANLAFADLAVTVLCMPFTMTTVIAGDWIFEAEVCNVNAFFEALCLVGSIHSLMYIGIHKFCSLVKPFSRIITHRRMWLMIGLAWISALSCAIGPLVGWSSNQYKEGTTQCGPKYPESVIERSHAYYVMVVGYSIPIFVTVVLYSCIFHTVNQYSHRLRLHSSMDIQLIFRHQTRIIATLFMLVITFVLFWTPYFLYVSIGMVIGFDKLPFWLNLFGYWCGYANSAVNPIIYAWRAKPFRDAIRDLFCCVCFRRPNRLSGSTNRLAKDAWNTRRSGPPLTRMTPRESLEDFPSLPTATNLNKKKSSSLQSLSNINALIFPYVMSSRPAPPLPSTEDNSLATSLNTLYTATTSEHGYHRDGDGSLWSIAGASSYAGGGDCDGTSGGGAGGRGPIGLMNMANKNTLERGQSLFELAVLAAEEKRMQSSQTSLDSLGSRSARCLSDTAKENLEMAYYEVRPRPMEIMSSFRSYQGSALVAHLCSPENETGPNGVTMVTPTEEPPLQVYGTFALNI